MSAGPVVNAETGGVRATGLGKRYGGVQALAAVDLAVEPGELMALLGPSGSGKTTLLRVLAGLESFDAGELLLDGRDAAALPPGRRGIGLVFQNYALFRHMSVFDNVAFGLTVRRPRPSKAAIAARVDELLTLVQLAGYERRRPNQLSGGQRQRVALARALAAEPTLLLLDEPFGALDRMVRVELRSWLHDLQRRLKITTILVTHDQEEATLMADRIAIFRAGAIEQVGTAADLRARPATPFVSEFLGRD